MPRIVYFPMWSLTPVFLSLFLVFCPAFSQGAVNEGNIRPWVDNPFYWQFKGKPVLLAGGTSNDNLFQYAGKNLQEELDHLAAVGGNYARCTMSSRDEGDERPFSSIGGKFDLDKWNPEYWRRFETFLVETARRGIVVQIEIWDPHDYYRQYWGNNPFNPRNNINYSAAESGLPEEANAHPADKRFSHPFFRTIPDDLNLEVPRQYQRRFVEEVLSYTLKYGHILYSISNEFSGSAGWSHYWAAVAQEVSEGVGREIFITEMWEHWDMRSPQHQATLDHPQRFRFVELSQNTHQFGQKHADGIFWVKRLLEKNPRPMNATKIYGSDGSRWGSSQEASERFWRNIFCGMASSRFHRPPAGLGSGEIASQHILGARRFLELFNLFEARPAPELLLNRLADEAYCLSGPDGTFAIYFPPVEPPTRVEKLFFSLNLFSAGKREVTLLASKQKKQLEIYWYSIVSTRMEKAGTVAGGSIFLTPPGEGHWVAILRPFT